MGSTDLRRGRLVGRNAEIGVLSDAIGAAARGYGHFILVEGEAGIGKSRLISEALSVAREHGAIAFSAAADELDGARPFGPLIGAFGRDFAQLVDSTAAAAQTGSEAAPSIHYRVRDAVVDLLDAASRSQGAVIAVDDLHWADTATLSLLRSLAGDVKHMPVLVLGAFRPSTAAGPLDRMIDSLVSDGATQIRLGPLDLESAVAIAAEETGGTPGPDLVAQLRDAGGNPFYVHELVRTLRDEGAIEVSDGVAESRARGVPDDLRLMIVRRLSLLPFDTVEALRLASVLGTSFSASDLALIGGRTAASLVEPLGAAVRAGVLAEHQDRLEFRHHLVRSAVYTDLTSAVRKALHRECARLLAEAKAPPERVATHMWLGAEPGDTEASAWLRRASREVAPRSIPVAIELLERAVELLPERSPAHDETRSELVARLVHCGRPEEAAEIGRELLEKDVDRETLAHTRKDLATAYTQLNRTDQALLVLASIVDDPHTSDIQRAGALADMSYVSLMRLDTSSGEGQASQALELAERVRSPYAKCAAFMTLSLVAGSKGQVTEAMEYGRRALGLAEDVRRAGEGYAVAELVYGLALLDADELDQAERVFCEARDRADEAGLVSQIPPYPWTLTVCNFLAGRWDDAITEAEAGLELVEETGYRAGVLAGYGVLARIQMGRGDLAAAERSVNAGTAEVAARGPSIGIDFLMWARGLLAEANGDPEGALAVLSTAWDLWAPLRYLFSYRTLAPDLVRLSMGAGESDRARAVTQVVEEGAIRSPADTAEGAALRCRGLCERDAESLRRSVDAYRRGPRPHEVALALEDLASVAEREEAIGSLEEALEFHYAVGAVRGVARVEAALRGLGKRVGRSRARPRAAIGWEALTDTERAVARLVAEGLTNPQIGERLYISRRTVQTHLKHTFQKLGCSTRAEVAAEAVRHDAGS